MTGLYIHLPFCKKKCPYCSFCSIECSNKEAIDAYINAVITELKSEIKEQEVDTIYIGGGTPSIIPFNLFEYLLIHLQSRINFKKIKRNYRWCSSTNINCIVITGSVELVWVFRVLMMRFYTF